MIKASRDVTIYDVAKALHLSPSTISRALKDHPHIKQETKRKIHAVAAEMGYRHNKFASSLRLKKTQTIGVVVPRLNSYFMAAAIAGIEKITSNNGYGLIISQSQESGRKEAACISTLFNSRVDGLIVSLASDTASLDHFDLLFARNIPVIFFDRVADCNNCMRVVIDNFRAGYEATAHLAEQGCKRIVHIGGNLLRNVYSDRFSGYRQALADNRIAYDQRLVFSGDMSEQSGTAIAQKMIRMKPRPDGIFTSNDTTAVAVIVELQKAGIRIPEDVAVVGFNNDPVSHFITPNLTTIDYPAREMGEIVANALVGKLNNPENDNLSTIILRHSLVVRGSSVQKKSSNK